MFFSEDVWMCVNTPLAAWLKGLSPLGRICRGGRRFNKRDNRNREANFLLQRKIKWISTFAHDIWSSSMEIRPYHRIRLHFSNTILDVLTSVVLEPFSSMRALKVRREPQCLGHVVNSTLCTDAFALFCVRVVLVLLIGSSSKYHWIVVLCCCSFSPHKSTCASTVL